MHAKEFKKIIDIQCQAAGVQLVLTNAEKIPYPVGDLMVNGYFDDIYSKRPTLACACGKTEAEWLDTFVHETCHMDQWLHNKKLWNQQYAENMPCDQIMDEWIAGKDFPVEKYTKAIRVMQELEIDCEKRTAHKIRHYDLPIDSVAYIKNANAYLLFYSVILLERKWYKRPPYRVPEILDILPNTFLDDYTTVPPEFLELCKQYVF